jgi:hypothetical protein
MFSDKAKVITMIITMLFISMFASGFIWQHVIPDMSRHYEIETAVLPNGSKIDVGYKSVSDGLEWFVIPSGFVLVALNVAILIWLFWISAEWEDDDAREFLDRISISKLLKTGLKKP